MLFHPQSIFHSSSIKLLEFMSDEGEGKNDLTRSLSRSRIPSHLAMSYFYYRPHQQTHYRFLTLDDSNGEAVGTANGETKSKKTEVAKLRGRRMLRATTSRICLPSRRRTSRSSVVFAFSSARPCVLRDGKSISFESDPNERRSTGKAGAMPRKAVEILRQIKRPKLGRLYLSDMSEYYDALRSIFTFVII